MKLIILVVLLFAQIANAQIKTAKLDKGAIPLTIKYAGKVKEVISFTDANGQYLVFTTETGETKVKGADMEDYRKAAVYAHCYSVSNSVYSLKWRVQDFLIECPVDIQAEFLPKTFAVTDLDKNGTAEVWLMYKIACRGDVSPSTMKIIMYEGAKKYAVRGTNKVDTGNNVYDGGTYAFDAAFKTAPEAFRKYAAQLWQKNLLETWK